MDTSTVWSWNTIIYTVVIIYIVLGVLYLLQSYVTKLVRWYFGNTRRRKDDNIMMRSSSSRHNMGSTSYRNSMSTIRCNRILFDIRLFMFNNCCCMTPRDQLDDVAQQLDENNHQYWTVLQVSSWAYKQLQKHKHRGENYNNDERASILQNNDSEDEYTQQRAMHKAILTLKKQRVDGASLSYLTLDHLLNFGIAFGVAVQLIKCLDELIPNNRRCGEACDEEMAIGKGGEELLPSWYHQSSSAETNNTSGETGGSQDGLEMSKRAQSVMKERFGMSLPTLRGQGDTNTDEHDNSDEQYPREESMQPQQTYPNHNHFNARKGITRSYDGTSAADNQEIPFQSSPLGQQHIDEILNAMPPHVRAIAERNPHLVSKLLIEKRRSQQQQHKQHTLANQSSLFAVSEEGDEESALYQSEEDVNIDQENVSLLRRRSNR